MEHCAKSNVINNHDNQLKNDKNVGLHKGNP